MKQTVVILAALAVIIAGISFALNRSSASEYMNHGKSNAFTDGTGYQGMWSHEELEYVVFIPPMVNVTSQSSQWPGMKPAPKGLTVIPEGLYKDGVLVATSKSKRAFVLLASGKIEPLNLNENLFAHMRLGKIQSLQKSPAWPEVAKAIRDAVASEVETKAERKLKAPGKPAP